nr:hypothetical protein [Candidatus Levybacteria bacterium]
MPLRKKVVKKKVTKHKVKKASKFSLRRLFAPFLVLALVLGAFAYFYLPDSSVLSSQVASENGVQSIPPLFNQNITLSPNPVGKNAYGKLNVEIVEYREWIGGKDRVMFMVNGSVGGLVPGRKYQLNLCHNTTNQNCVAQPGGIIADNSGNIPITNQLLDVTSSPSYKFIVRDVFEGALPSDHCSFGTPCLEATFNYITTYSSSAPGSKFEVITGCFPNGHDWMNKAHVDMQVNFNNSTQTGSWITYTLREDAVGSKPNVRLLAQSPTNRTIKGVKYHGTVPDAFSQFNEAEKIIVDGGKKYVVELWDGDFRYSYPDSNSKLLDSRSFNTLDCGVKISTLAATPSMVPPTKLPTKYPTPTPAGGKLPPCSQYG